MFHDLLSEYVAQLSQQDFRFIFELDWPNISIAVHPPYIKRLMDNISSNLIKYVARETPVLIGAVYENGGVRITVQNCVRSDLPDEDSTKIGLSNIKTMMEKMNGSCCTTQQAELFSVSLFFPGAVENTVE